MTLRELLKNALNEKEIMANVIALFAENLNTENKDRNELATAIQKMAKQLVELPKSKKENNDIYIIKQYEYFENINEYYDSFCKYKDDTNLYGFSETDWMDLIDSKIYQGSIDAYGKAKVIYGILFEMSWFGYEYEEVKIRQKNFIKHIKELEEQNERTASEKLYINLQSLKSELDIKTSDEENKKYIDNLERCQKLNKQEIKRLGIEYLYSYC